jgi:hypothetical protein
VTLLVLPPNEVDYFESLTAAGAGDVMFVCCGDHGRSMCSRFLFTVTIWTVSLSMDEPFEWVKDGLLDCDELWTLQAYKGLPLVSWSSQS